MTSPSLKPSSPSSCGSYGNVARAHETYSEAAGGGGGGGAAADAAIGPAGFTAALLSVELYGLGTMMASGADFTLLSLPEPALGAAVGSTKLDGNGPCAAEFTDPPAVRIRIVQHTNDIARGKRQPPSSCATYHRTPHPRHVRGLMGINVFEEQRQGTAAGGGCTGRAQVLARGALRLVRHGVGAGSLHDRGCSAGFGCGAGGRCGAARASMRALAATPPALAGSVGVAAAAGAAVTAAGAAAAGAIVADGATAFAGVPGFTAAAATAGPTAAPAAVAVCSTGGCVGST